MLLLNLRQTGIIFEWTKYFIKKAENFWFSALRSSFICRCNVRDIDRKQLFLFR